jgi:hypothetical protein
MNLELTTAERDLLLETLHERLGEIREQIHHSMTSGFTDQLKQAEQTARDLLAKLEATAGE